MLLDALSPIEPLDPRVLEHAYEWLPVQRAHGAYLRHCEAHGVTPELSPAEVGVVLTALYGKPTDDPDFSARCSRTADGKQCVGYAYIRCPYSVMARETPGGDNRSKDRLDAERAYTNNRTQAYRVRSTTVAKGREVVFSYGRGLRKLKATARCLLSGMWRITAGDGLGVFEPEQSRHVLRYKWGAWAAANYTQPKQETCRWCCDPKDQCNCPRHEDIY